MPTAEDSPKLIWPPTKEDLQRLYVDQKLSAMKIAKIYDLKYASPKTAESTILYHLHRNGITRRDPAEHNRKATPSVIDEWVSRYQKGESLKQIAGDSVDPVTVFNHLRKRGLQLRDKVEAQIEAVTIHKRTPFAGGIKEIAYLVGLAIGDLYVQRHGRAVRARTATTHPRMTRLFRELFGPYGPVYEYPKEGGITGYEWSLDCDLDRSFEFLIGWDKYIETIFESDELFLSFLAGFFDAEGSLYYHKKGKHGAFELTIVNTNEVLLKRIADRLQASGYGVAISKKRQDPKRALERGIKNAGDWIWCIALWRYDDVVRLLQAMPIRHPEKVEKRNIALRLEYRSTLADREAILADWEELLGRIRQDGLDYIALAKERIAARFNAKKEIGAK